MVLSRVDFPQALAPTMTVILPLGIVTSTPSTTTRRPYPERSPWVASSGTAGGVEVAEEAAEEAAVEVSAEVMRRRPVC